MIAKKIGVDIDMNGNTAFNLCVEGVLALPSTSPQNRLVLLIPKNQLYVFRDDEWVLMGELNPKNLSAFVNDVGYLTKENAGLDQKVDAADVYTIAQIDRMLLTKVDMLPSNPAEGTFTKVTINREGQVTKGTTLVKGDLPALQAEDIVGLDGAIKSWGRVTGQITATPAGTVFTHNLNVEFPQVSVYKGTTKVSATVTYESRNSIKVYSNVAQAVTVVVSA